MERKIWFAPFNLPRESLPVEMNVLRELCKPLPGFDRANTSKVYECLRMESMELRSALLVVFPFSMISLMTPTNPSHTTSL